MDHYPVVIPPRILAGLRRHAAAAAGAECCGALIGERLRDAAEVRAMIPLENGAASAARYSIDADEVLRLERQAASVGQQVLGFYHSHPLGSAEPSAADLELAFPGYLYVIVAARDGSVRVWRLREERDGFAELPLKPLAGAA